MSADALDTPQAHADATHPCPMGGAHDMDYLDGTRPCRRCGASPR